MKVLVTGAGGFIGSHVVEKLLSDGYEVKAFVHYNSQDRWGWLEDLEGEFEVFKGDIRDFDSVSKALNGVKAIFHLAALIGIPYSYETPVAYIKTNIEGTYNILEAAKQHSELERIVHISTSEVYGTAKYIPINESHPYNPQSPYAATKVAADMLALSYYRSFDSPVTVVRPFNTFGPRQSLRAVIPTIITQFLSGRYEIKIGNLDTKRDFLFVKDTARGIIKVGLHPGTIGGVFNVGTGQSYSISEVINLVEKITGKSIKVLQDESRFRPEKSEVEILQCNFEKAKSLTGWSPQYSFEEGLEETVLWYEKNLGKFKNFEKYNI